MENNLEYCIIGGSGFIGSRLCERLNILKSIDFVIYDKIKSATFGDKSRIGDVRLLGDLRRHVAMNSVVINLAAEHRDDISSSEIYHDVNVDGAKNICTVARERNIKKIIFTSTVAVYGFAPPGTDESGLIAPFNEYGRTKSEAENIYREWQIEDPNVRSLVIVRPTLVFGEKNRGNFYNLFKQIAAGTFLMVGDGLNRKSVAYVENVAAFLEYSLRFQPGIHVYNYIDEPNFTMNELVCKIKGLLGRPAKIRIRIPIPLGLLIGSWADFFSKISRIKYPISSIRVRKFCANSTYKSAVASTGFIPPIPLEKAIEKTIRFELNKDYSGKLFYSE